MAGQILERLLPLGWEIGYSGTEFQDYVRVHGLLPTGSSSYQDVNDFGDFTFIDRDTPVAVYISSSDNSDDEDILVTGLDADGELQTATQALVGQTKTEVGSGLTWDRVFRIEVADTTVPAGDVYCYQDDSLSAGVPDNLDTKGLAKITQGFGQSLNGSFTIPSNKRGLITDFRGGYSNSGGLRIRGMVTSGGQAPKAKFVGNGIAVDEPDISIPIPVTANDDIVLEGLAASGTQSISGELLIVLFDA